MEQHPRGHKKLLKAWIFYDWANSVYSLSIVSSIFPIFYGLLFKIANITHIDLFGFSVKNTAAITFVTALAFLIVVVISPILSGIADYLGKKKNIHEIFLLFGGYFLYWFVLVFIRKYLFWIAMLSVRSHWFLGKYRLLQFLLARYCFA